MPVSQKSHKEAEWSLSGGQMRTVWPVTATELFWKNKRAVFPLEACP